VKTCSWCDQNFKPTVSYQIYCSAICREEATKEKVLERQKILKRKRFFGKTRYCSGGCGSTLSPYNESTFCPDCYINPKQVSRALKELKRLGIIDYDKD
jgi:hypothetical protein